MIRDRITQFLYTLVAKIWCSKGNILLGRVSGAGPAQEITIGSGLVIAGTTLSAPGGTADNTVYDAGTWDGITNLSPSKNAARDKFVLVDAAQAAAIATASNDATTKANAAQEAAAIDATTKANAAQAASQPLDSDLTAYANAADAAARQALQGPLFTVSETPPSNTARPWFDPETGWWAAWNGSVWVVISGPSGLTGRSERTVTETTAPTGTTLYGGTHVDETIYLKSVTTSPVPLIMLVLPGGANAFVGQTKTFVSSKNITSLGVSVASTGVLEGAATTQAVAYEPLSYQCVKVESTVATWLRLA